MTDAARQRLGHTVERRIQTLGLDYTDVARKANISIETLAKIRRGQRVTSKMLRRLEAALGWNPHSADEVLAGGEPTELSGNVAGDTVRQLRGAPDADPTSAPRPPLWELSRDWDRVQGLTWVVDPDNPDLLYYTLRREYRGAIWTHSSWLPPEKPFWEVWALLGAELEEQLRKFEERLGRESGE